MTEHKSWIEIVLMPIVVTLVGIAGTFFITSQQEKSAGIMRDTQLAIAQEMAAADRQIEILGLFAEKIISTKESERILALNVLRAVDAKFAETLATAVSNTEPKGSPIKVVAEQVAQEAATRGYSFPVVGSFKKFKDAVGFADKLMNKKLKYKPGIYRSENYIYGVSLGGYVSYDEALKRVKYAKNNNIASDAYVWTSRVWGVDLFKQ